MATRAAPTFNSPLAGRVALVTGAFGGLGLHFAQVLAAHGAKVALAGRCIELGRGVVGGLGAAVARPGDVRAYAMDVTDPASVADAIAAISAELAAPQIVVNNAGAVARAPSLELSEADWQAVIDVNLSSVFRVAQASAREPVRTGTRGTIVNIASILGLRVRTQVAAYVASQAAVVQLTHALALEWAGHGIRVNAMRPATSRPTSTATCCAHRPARRSSRASRRDVSGSSRSSTGRCCCSHRTRRCT